MGYKFVAHAYDNPLSDLRNLKQVDTRQEYLDVFDELYPRAGIREDHALSFFFFGPIDALYECLGQKHWQRLILLPNFKNWQLLLSRSNQDLLLRPFT